MTLTRLLECNQKQVSSKAYDDINGPIYEFWLFNHDGKSPIPLEQTLTIFGIKTRQIGGIISRGDPSYVSFFPEKTVAQVAKAAGIQKNQAGNYIKRVNNNSWLIVENDGKWPDVPKGVTYLECYVDSQPD